MTEQPTPTPASAPLPDPTTAIRVGILGPIVVFDDGQPVNVPARLDRSVLGHLVLSQGRAIPVDLLIDAVWGSHPPRQARNSLQVKISRLRRLLGDLGSALIYSQDTYRLALEPHQADASTFSRSVSDASHLIANQHHDQARNHLRHALSLWRGIPLSDLDEHPRIVHARQRLQDDWLTAQELLAETDIAANKHTDAIRRLRAALSKDPLRPRARLLLMRALDMDGRRAEALAVYDAGRRQLAEDTGLAPPSELQDAFEALLAAERAATRRSAAHEITQAPPPGAIDTARWLAAEGDTSAAAELAVRGAWWWWFGGNRTAGRDLLEELIGSEADTSLNPQTALRASAWLAVFQAVEADAENAISQGEKALHAAAKYGWTRHEALAGVLLADRLYQRGAHDRADYLLATAQNYFGTQRNEWGAAIAGVVAAKGLLLRGNVTGAAAWTLSLIRDFDELGDRAGQIMSLDAAGYCAEVQGDLHGAARLHRRALQLARRVQAPEWETAQLTRLGSVLALLNDPDAPETLREATDLATAIHSNASLALARNGLGLAVALHGDAEHSRAAHQEALHWYEQQRSDAGISYTAGRLAVEHSDTSVASNLADRSLRHALVTSDPRAIAHGLEAVARTTTDPTRGAQALGGARALRHRTGAPLPTALAAPLIKRQDLFAAQLGAQFSDHLRTGARQARRIAPASQP